MLSLTDWRVRRADRVVATIPELKVRPGEVVGLVGPSGSGKSSLMAALANRPGASSDGGELTWERETCSPGDLVAKTGCAALFDDRPAPEAATLTVGDWLAYQAAARKARDPEAASAAAQKALGLTAQVDTQVRHLSGGMAERLLLASLVVRPAALVLIDHPLARLDAAGEFALGALLDRFRGGGDSTPRSAVLWAATDRARLESHCDRVVHL